jgi:hypothetical protein
LNGRLAPALRGTLGLQLALALLLTLLVTFLVMVDMGLGSLAVRLPLLGTGNWLAPFLALTVPAVWALGRALKAVNLIWALGRWQPVQPGGLGEAERSWLDAADHAFGQAEFGRALSLLERFPREARRGSLGLNLGRILLWNGRWEDGLTQLQGAGEQSYWLGWLKSRRTLGLAREPYFGPLDPGRAGQTWPAGLACGLVLGATAVLVLPLYASLKPQLLAISRGFDISGFEAPETHGRFVLHFHDAAFAGMVADLADDALNHDLAFLGQPSDLFGEQEIQFFLCDDQAEYMKRSPFPAAWEAGCAVPDKASIFLYRPSHEGDLGFQVTVAHELSHLIYQRMGIHGRNDSWLNEGLANYVGYKYAFDRNNIPRQAWLQEHEFSRLRGHFIPFNRFFTMEPHELAAADDVEVFYEQGSSVVYLLIEEYGRDSFLKFMKVYAGGASVDRALASAYPSLPDLNALAAVWGLFFNDAATVPSHASFDR